MDELQELLSAIEALDGDPTPEQLATLVENLDGDALAALSTEASEAVETIMAGEITDAELATLELLGFAAGAVQTRQLVLLEADEARQTRAAEIAAQIRGSDTDPEGEDGDDGKDGQDGKDGTDAESAEVGQPDPEPEPEPAPQPVAEEAPLPVAASGTRRPAVGRVAARRPAAAAPLARSSEPGRLPDDIADWGLTASANAPNVVAGSRITSRQQLADAFMSAVTATRGYRHGPRVKIGIARAGNEDPQVLYGEDRFLGRDAGVNHQRIQAAAGELAIMRAGGFDGITAAGGICAPLPVRWDLPICGSEERPVRDNALVRFGADRGGIRVIPPPMLEDLTGAIGVWTEANDVDPDDPVVKPCLTLTCPDDEESFVAAITQCLQIGNFRARFFGEQVEAWMRLAAVAHARIAETRLLTAMGAASTQVTHGQLLGTTPDVLAFLDRATAIIRSSNRLSAVFPMRFVFPFWLYNQMRTDEARRLPGGSPDERYAVTEADFTQWMSARGVTPTPVLDGETGQIFARQGDAPMIGWPSTVVTYLYPEGSHLFLDGGTLDLGIVRDSTLNATNDLQIFAETFEGHVFHGCESWRAVLDTCPDGSISGTVDIDPCTTGS